jgi:hypothetical protein
MRRFLSLFHPRPLTATLWALGDLLTLAAFFALACFLISIGSGL